MNTTTPPPKPGVDGSVALMPDSYKEIMYGGDPNCSHLWVLLKWDGWECNDCSGWFCA